MRPSEDKKFLRYQESSRIEYRLVPDHGALQNCTSWNRLIPAIVEIRYKGRLLRTGIVEDAMPDSSAYPRIMLEAALGYQVWAEPQYLLRRPVTL